CDTTTTCSPVGGLPSQPFVMSNRCLPMTIAPMAAHVGCPSHLPGLRDFLNLLVEDRSRGGFSSVCGGDKVCAMGTVQVRRVGEVAEIVLSRPEKLNAMNMAWVNGLVEAVASLERDKPAIVVVRGEGRAFCAGLDLDMLAAESMPDGFYALQEEAFVGLERLDRLVVAQIHGYCLGGGLQLALACDIRILAEDAVLGLPAAAEGLPPGMATWRLPRYVGL